MANPRELIAEVEFRRYARTGGQVLCPGHDAWWLPAGCSWCKAVI